MSGLDGGNGGNGKQGIFGAKRREHSERASGAERAGESRRGIERAQYCGSVCESVALRCAARWVLLPPPLPLSVDGSTVAKRWLVRLAGAD